MYHCGTHNRQLVKHPLPRIYSLNYANPRNSLGRIEAFLGYSRRLKTGVWVLNARVLDNCSCKNLIALYDVERRSERGGMSWISESALWAKEWLLYRVMQANKTKTRSKRVGWLRLEYYVFAEVQMGIHFWIGAYSLLFHWIYAYRNLMASSNLGSS